MAFLLGWTDRSAHADEGQNRHDDDDEADQIDDRVHAVPPQSVLRQENGDGGARLPRPCFVRQPDRRPLATESRMAAVSSIVASGGSFDEAPIRGGCPSISRLFNGPAGDPHDKASYS
jgi:hypothetical protein